MASSWNRSSRPSIQAFGVPVPDASWFDDSKDSPRNVDHCDQSTSSGSSGENEELRYIAQRRGSSTSVSSIKSHGSWHGSTRGFSKALKKMGLGPKSPGRSKKSDPSRASPASPVFGSARTPSLAGTETDASTRAMSPEVKDEVVERIQASLSVRSQLLGSVPKSSKRLTKQKRRSSFRNKLSWFNDDDASSACSQVEWAEKVLDEDGASFHRKLQRKTDPSLSPTKRKMTAKEGYSGAYDYGSSKGYGPKPVPKPAARKTPSLKDMLDANHALYRSRSQDGGDSVVSQESSAVGIAPPDPLNTSTSDEFILPTCVVGSNLFRSTSVPTLTGPPSLVSPLSTPASTTSSRRIRTVPSSPLNGVVPNLHLPVLDSDCSSVGSGYTQYSDGGSNRSDKNRGREKSIARLIHASIEDDDLFTRPPLSSESSDSLYIATLEDKVCALEEKIEALRKEQEQDADKDSHARELQMRELRNNQRLLEDPSLSRIFLLLLQPQHRKFELIQVLCHLSAATVGDVVDRIPSCSTVSYLADQGYRGLCRPKDGIEMTCSGAHMGKVPGGWRVVRGEILVAIPHGYTGQECQLMSQPILHDPKLVRLLRRKDPLSPIRKKPSSKRKGRTIATGVVREATSQVVNLLAVHENETTRDEELSRDLRRPTYEALQNLSNISDSMMDTSRSTYVAPLAVQDGSFDTDDDDASTCSAIQKAEHEVQLLRDLANNVYTGESSFLERVAEVDNESVEDDDDDDMTIASAVWNERVEKMGRDAESGLCNDLMEILVPEKVSRVRITNPQKAQDDSFMFKCVVSFLALLGLRMVFKSVTGFSVAPTCMGGQGVIFCAAILKSLVHLQRVYEANAKMDRRGGE